jgi:YD repeat-containing protein
VNEYDDRGHLTRATKHTGQVYSAVWNGDRKASEIDEAGVETAYGYDSLGRVQTMTRKGIAAGGGFPAQPDVVTTYTYDAAGRKLSETVTAGGLSLVTSTAYDRAGRVIRETDQAGLVTQFS